MQNFFISLAWTVTGPALKYSDNHNDNGDNGDCEDGRAGTAVVSRCGGRPWEQPRKWTWWQWWRWWLLQTLYEPDDTDNVDVDGNSSREWCCFKIICAGMMMMLCGLIYIWNCGGQVISICRESFLFCILWFCHGKWSPVLDLLAGASSRCSSERDEESGTVVTWSALGGRLKKEFLVWAVHLPTPT